MEFHAPVSERLGSGREAGVQDLDHAIGTLMLAGLRSRWRLPLSFAASTRRRSRRVIERGQWEDLAMEFISVAR